MVTTGSQATSSRGTLNIRPDQYINFALHPKLNSGMAGFDLVVNGDVDLSLTESGKKVKKLPAAEIIGNLRADETCALKGVGGVTVRGMTVVSGSKINGFADSFRAVGDFEARNCWGLTHMFGRCEGNVDLSGSSILGLASDFYCGGNLNVDGCPNARVLDCQIGGDFSAWGTGVRKLGKNFRVGGNAKFSKCDRLSSIGDIGNPNDVTIRGEGFQRIDKGFKCRGTLELNRCGGLYEIPQDIDCRSLELTLLPIRQLKVNKTLDRCQIERCRRLESITVDCRDLFEMSGCSPSNFDGIGRGVKLLKIIECESRICLEGDWGGDVTMRNSDGPDVIPPNFHARAISVFTGAGGSKR